jgi:D-alanyl-D-alanine-carboxypeptidase/D-alanyl-D-alanine-endopeptidase
MLFRCARSFLLLALTFAMGLSVVCAQTTNQTAVLKEAISLTGPVMWISSGSPGMVLVVVRGNDVVIEGYGETAKGNGKEPDAKSLVRLGSISKTFAGELLASLSLDGKVSLTDPLKKYANGATVPSFGQREITLLDLATHSAGLPREIGDIPQGVKPFTWPAKQRWDWLAKYRLEWEPGKTWLIPMSVSTYWPTHCQLRPANRILICCTTASLDR